MTFELGVNYWPRRRAMYMWRELDLGEVREELAHCRDLGFEVVRFFLLTEDFLPDAETVAAHQIANLVEVARLARDVGLRSMPTLITINMSGKFFVDWAIILVYFAFVLGIGFALKKYMKSSSDFLLSGRSIPSWVTGLAFLSANLGALEVMGMAGQGYKYGMLTAHFYWIGAIPAMIFVGIFMMPFYYGSRARSVPEYLKLRFDEKTRGLNAISFAVLTVLMSGINMYAMAVVFKVMLGWSMETSIIISAAVVLGYTYLGGLTSSIYNEVLQFFLIVFGFAPLSIVGVHRAGGWSGLEQKLVEHLGAEGAHGMTHIWSSVGSASSNPMGIEIFGLVMGLGFVLSFGYWCTDFLVIQRAMASKDLAGAQRTPLIAAVPKALFPFIVIVPGLVAAALALELPGGRYDYALPMMLKEFYPSGLLGLGMAALLASFMSGMAGNVTAFNTVWTFDIYQAYLNKKADDRQLLRMGKQATFWGVAVSIAAAYLVMQFNSLMDYMQLLFSFFNAPLFATFLLGMFWKRTTGHGAFIGLSAGIGAGVLAHLLKVSGTLVYASDMAAAFYGAIASWTTCFVITVAISLFTSPRPDGELVGLVYSLTSRPKSTVAWYLRPGTAAVVVVAVVVALNARFF
jgi:SSS family solute:Na+ symporter